MHFQKLPLKVLKDLLRVEEVAPPLAGSKGFHCVDPEL